jgi:hypothetical protein
VLYGKSILIDKEIEALLIEIYKYYVQKEILDNRMSSYTIENVKYSLEVKKKIELLITNRIVGSIRYRRTNR